MTKAFQLSTKPFQGKSHKHFATRDGTPPSSVPRRRRVCSSSHAVRILHGRFTWGCVTGAVVRRSFEHPRCESTRTLLLCRLSPPSPLHTLPRPWFSFSPYHSTAARGVVPQQSSRLHSSPNSDREAFSFCSGSEATCRALSPLIISWNGY